MKMKSILAALAMTTALTLPGLASARPVTLSATVGNYYGGRAYMAFYVTDSSGAYVGSLWMAGGRSRYYRHLSNWYNLSRGNLRDINGITGASVGSGRRLQINLDLADSLFDAGYELHIDAAAENWMQSPNDVVVPLTTSGAGTPVRGRSLIRSFQYDM